MKTFSHSGRFGDLFYALWTMKELGGGKLFINDFHTPNWNLEMAWTLNTFLLYQSFIEAVEFIPYAKMPKVDYDLHEAEADFNPEAFPECPDAAIQWPGSINIAKRYAVRFGLTYRPGEKWLEAPDSNNAYQIVIHAPERRMVRSLNDWAIIGSSFWNVFSHGLIGQDYQGDWLSTAAEINSSSLFLGAVSGPHALAEGLGKTRFVEQAPDCFNVSVTPPSQCINGWSNEKVIEEVRKLL